MPRDFTVQRQRMNATGIGFAGIEGVWWLPAVEAFALPTQVARNLTEIGAALFALFDAVIELYGTPAGAAGGLDALLNHKVPLHIPRLVCRGRVESVRPDFQLEIDGGSRISDKTLEVESLHALHTRAKPPCGTQHDVSPATLSQPETSLTYNFVATELEICPSAHGFAHAMQVGYNLRTDLVESFARYLDGRELLFVGASQWSEFLFEQLAFCHALAEVGARGRVLYDLPLSIIADEVRRGQRWQPPMFGIKEKTSRWDDDVMGRIRAHEFESFLWPDADWPEEVGDAVVFRFGYFDCFPPNKLQRFGQWQAQGATLLNPATFILDSKVIMAALGLALVRERINDIHPETLAVLDRCLPETLLLRQETLPRVMAEKDDWVIKFAGFDGGNQAWGGRSLQLGLNHSAANWRQVLLQALELPWPVVAQRVIPSAQINIAYVDADETVRMMQKGTTRLRTFFLRNETDVVACGSHLTVSSAMMQVSEATDAVQAPVVFQDYREK